MRTQEMEGPETNRPLTAATNQPDQNILETPETGRGEGEDFGLIPQINNDLKSSGKGRKTMQTRGFIHYLV
jgi:hypothetical protein